MQLFEKVGRRIRPSPAGEAALGALTRVFDEASSLGTLLDELAGARVTTLRIAASDYLGEALLVPVIRAAGRGQGAAALRDHHHPLDRGQPGWWPRARSTWPSSAPSASRRPTSARCSASRSSGWRPRLRGAGRGLGAARLAREPLLRLLPGSRGPPAAGRVPRAHRASARRPPSTCPACR